MSEAAALPEQLQGFEATFNYLLVKPDKVTERTETGLYLPETAVEKQQKAAVRGQVLLAGDRTDYIKVGDTVYYGKYAGNELVFDGELFTLMSDEDVLLRNPNPTQNESEQEHESGRTDTGRTGCGGSGDDVRDGNRCGPATGIRANAGNTDPRTPRRD